MVTADGTATQPVDYTGLSTSGSFDETNFPSVTVGGATRYRAIMDFTVSVADDTIDEPDETLGVTLALSDASITYLLLGDAVVTVTIVGDCRDVDIRCATATFDAEVEWEGRYDLHTGEADDMEFLYNGEDYRLWSIEMHQNGHNAGDDNNIVLPFGIPERTEFLIDFSI